MTTKERIQFEVGKKHNLRLCLDDPIFAVFTANEILLDEILLKIKNINQTHLIDVENANRKIYADTKEMAEKKINYAYQEVVKNIEEQKNLILEEIKNALTNFDIQTKEIKVSKDTNNNLLQTILLNSFFLLFGLIIGLIIK